MDPHTELFQKHRPRLLGLAYRMLGTPADAEDVLHDAWLRWHAQDKSSLDDPEAWLVTVVTRLALDRLRRAKLEREHYTGPWLPEPLIEPEEHPEAKAEHAETLSMSFLLILERLTAEERAAFLLHDVFDYSHAEAAAMIRHASVPIAQSSGCAMSASASPPMRKRNAACLNVSRKRLSVPPKPICAACLPTMPCTSPTVAAWQEPRYGRCSAANGSPVSICKLPGMNKGTRCGAACICSTALRSC
jgi:RNA polymerase sigma factor (sigma-70 family)